MKSIHHLLTLLFTVWILGVVLVAAEEEEETTAADVDVDVDMTPEDTVVVDEKPVYEILPFHLDASVVPLTDAIFEHETQASTGQTTGSWLVAFYDQDLMVTGPTISPDVWSEHHIVLGSMQAKDAPDILARFEIEQDQLPVVVFLHEKKQYVYPANSLVSGVVSWKDLESFCVQPVSESDARDIPPVPSFWTRLEAKLASMGLNTPMVVGAQVMVVVIGLWVTAIAGAARKPKSETKKGR